MSQWVRMRSVATHCKFHSEKSQIVHGHINEHEIYFKLNLKYRGFVTPVFSEYKPKQLNLNQELQIKTIVKMTSELI